MLGQLLLSLSAVVLIFGAFVADFNETHVMNPRWPPHARFHNGQTMSMSVCLGLATLFYTYGPWSFSKSSFTTSTSPSSKATKTTKAGSAPAVETVQAKKDRYLTAAIFSSLYYITSISAILYPGSLAVDPEFGEGFPQFPLFLGLLSVTWVGWWIETRA